MDHPPNDSTVQSGSSNESVNDEQDWRTEITSEILAHFDGDAANPDATLLLWNLDQQDKEYIGSEEIAPSWQKLRTKLYSPEFEIEMMALLRKLKIGTY